MPATSSHHQFTEARRKHAAAPMLIQVRPLMTARQVAQVLGMGERTVWRMTSRSRAGYSHFPRPVRIGRKAVRWRWQDVEKYLHKLAGN